MRRRGDLRRDGGFEGPEEATVGTRIIGPANRPCISSGGASTDQFRTGSTVPRNLPGVPTAGPNGNCESSARSA